MNLLTMFGQQAIKYNVFEQPAYQPITMALVALAMLLGFGLMFAFTRVPQPMRKYVIGAFTFLSGGFYVLLWLWPANVSFKPGQATGGMVESFAVGLQETLPRVSDVAQILTGFLLLLGIISLLRQHITRATKGTADSAYSWVLLSSMALMTVVGYSNWIQRTFMDPKGELIDKVNWTPVQYANDLLFDGAYQQMEAAMFSIIAFYILSAAYRAFRIRSIESSVLMGSALILMLSLMGALTYAWGHGIDDLIKNTHNTFWGNFKIEVVASWVKEFLQKPSIRAVEFGIGLGALSMGLRIWLGLEKGGGGA